MGQKYSYNRGSFNEIAFWLIFDAWGSVRLTRGEPELGRGERGMSIVAKIPHALFNVPTLRASLDVSAAEPLLPTFDLSAASAALKQAIGVDIDLQIVPAPSGEDG